MKKITITLDTVFEKKISNIRKEIGAVVSAIVEDEFVSMLYDTPQWTGNFCANMSVQVGSRRGSGGGTDYLPINTTLQQAFERGSGPAIGIARGRSSGLKAKLVAGFQRGAGLWPAVTIYNNHPKAGTIEALSSSALRDVNRPGAHPMARMESSLQGRFAQNLEIGTPHWNFLVAEEIL